MHNAWHSTCTLNATLPKRKYTSTDRKRFHHSSLCGVSSKTILSTRDGLSRPRLVQSQISCSVHGRLNLLRRRTSPFLRRLLDWFISNCTTTTHTTCSMLWKYVSFLAVLSFRFFLYTHKVLLKCMDWFLHSTTPVAVAVTFDLLAVTALRMGQREGNWGNHK